MNLVDQVSETERISWDDAFKLPIYEFFNVVSYIRWKNDRQKELINKWKTRR